MMKIGHVGHAEDATIAGGLASMRDPVVGVRKPPKKSGGDDSKPTGKDAVPQIHASRDEGPRLKPGPHWDDNDLVYLTGLDMNLEMDAAAFGAFIGSLVETADPMDRAHKNRRLIPGLLAHFEESWVLLSHGEIDHPKFRKQRRSSVTRRRYHPSQLTSRGVSFDSMYDSVHAIAKGIQFAGINLGWNMTSESYDSQGDRAKVLAGLTRDQARQILTPQMKDKMSEDEAQLSAEATRLIEEHEQAEAEAELEKLKKKRADEEKNKH